MNFKELLEVVQKLELDGEQEIYRSSDDSRFIIKRPKEVPKRLKRKYDPEKNIQVWIQEQDNERFMPNHLRLFIDLEFKRMAKPEIARSLMLMFDHIFYGENPEAFTSEFEDIRFPTPLRPLDYDLYLEQLLLAEQTIGYTHPSKFDPIRLYLHGWVRCALTGDMEIDRLCWGATRHPPTDKFTRQDNKKHKEYNPKPKKLWYAGT